MFLALDKADKQQSDKEGGNDDRNIDHDVCIDLEDVEVEDIGQDVQSAGAVSSFSFMLSLLCCRYT